MLTKRILASLGAPLAVAGTGSLILNLFQAIKDNKLSVKAGFIATKIANITASENIELQKREAIALETQLQKELYNSSRIQGITTDIMLFLVMLPFLLQSFRHHVSATNGTCRYLIDEWDYIVGRVLQTGGLALVGKGLHSDGAGNPQEATAYCAAAPVAIGLGTFFVEHNRSKKQTLSAQLEAQLDEPFVPAANAPDLELAHEGKAQSSLPAYSYR